MAIRNNVTRMLDVRGIPYVAAEYDAAAFHSADEVAHLIGVPEGQVFKTIVVLREDRRKKPLLVIVPADREIDVKRLAAALDEKRLHVAPKRDAEAMTHLPIGAISALALVSRGFQVVLDRAGERFAEEGIYVSAGQRGLNVRIRPADLLALTGATWTDAVRE